MGFVRFFFTYLGVNATETFPAYRRDREREWHVIERIQRRIGQPVGAALSAGKHLFPLLIGGICVWVVVQRLDGIHFPEILAAFQRILFWQWAVALALTALSFWAVGRYDAVLHRHLGTGVCARRARRAGAAAIALAQTLGFGVITGALCRIRLVPGLSLKQAFMVSTAVAASFLIAWAALVSVILLCLPAPQGISPLYGAMGLLACLVLTALVLTAPVLRIGKFRFTLPSLPACLALLGLTLLDTLAAAAAFYVLFPGGCDIGFLQLLPVFLLALGAGLISGSPGGAGPFELTMLSLLPAIAPVELIATIMCFRLVYYAIPACLAALALLWPPRSAAPPVAVENAICPSRVSDAPRAEIGVVRQNGGVLVPLAGNPALVVQTGQTVSAFFDPTRNLCANALDDLVQRARTRNKYPCLYKCMPRSAVVARRAGHKALHIANEAILNPADYDLQGARYRQLRRKLRHAEKAGIKIRTARELPLDDMAQVDQDWQATHGRARGLSMGWFEPDYVRGQRVYLAYQGDQLLGFITVHGGQRTQCLDLMRNRPGAPDGMMHMLVHTALNDARRDGISCFSLAALPSIPKQTQGVTRVLRRAIVDLSGGRGLAQFKHSFAPRLIPLYLTSTCRLGLLIAVLDLTWAIRFPHHHRRQFGPLPHNDYDHNAFAPTVKT